MAERASIELGGAALELTAHPAVVWPAARTAIVADVHLGKTATFRAHGVPAPEGTTGRDLDRLAALLADSGASRLVVLGDLVHGPAWDNPATRSAVEAWRARFAGVEVVCVRGNHDRAAGVLPATLGISECEEPCADGPFTLAHDPACAPGAPVLAGHLHPEVRLRGAGGGLRARCFWRRGGRLVLPAFGSFTGGCVVRPGVGDGVWVTDGRRVVAVGAPAAPGLAQERHGGGGLQRG